MVVFVELGLAAWTWSMAPLPSAHSVRALMQGWGSNRGGTCQSCDQTAEQFRDTASGTRHFMRLNGSSRQKTRHLRCEVSFSRCCQRRHGFCECQPVLGSYFVRSVCTC